MESRKLTAALLFRAGDRVATMVTNGIKVKTYEADQSREHLSTLKAIAYLEARGYHVQTDVFI